MLPPAPGLRVVSPAAGGSAGPRAVTQCLGLTHTHTDTCTQMYTHTQPITCGGTKPAAPRRNAESRGGGHRTPTRRVHLRSHDQGPNGDKRQNNSSSDSISYCRYISYIYIKLTDVLTASAYQKQPLVAQAGHPGCLRSSDAGSAKEHLAAPRDCRSDGSSHRLYIFSKAGRGRIWLINQIN